MDAVTLVEVAPRDGFQAIRQPIPTSRKIDAVRALASTGLSRIEIGAFVSPKAIPQMADIGDVWAAVEGRGPIPRIGSRAECQGSPVGVGGRLHRDRLCAVRLRGAQPEQRRPIGGGVPERAARGRGPSQRHTREASCALTSQPASTVPSKGRLPRTAS